MSIDMDGPDLGPLAWVKTEIDQALSEARQALSNWNGEDINPLRSATAHLHQVYGALHIVDFKGVSLMTLETERLVQAMVDSAALRTRASAEVALRAITTIKDYLDGLMNGAAHAEMRLAPIHAEVITQRGGDAPSPSELFFPDTSEVRVPRDTPEPSLLDEASRGQLVRAARARYQRGLLRLLQNKDALAGLAQMEVALREVGRVAPGASQYAFWWTTTGLIQGLREGGVHADVSVKRLCGRLDLQIRRLAEGSRQLAERLFRDVLYHVATDRRPGDLTREIRERYALERLLPSAAGGISAAQLPELMRLREQIEQAKEHWMRYCGGRGDSLGPFQNAATALFEAAVRLPNPAMHSLTRIVQAVAKRLPGDVDASGNERLQVEMASTLLLASNAAEHFANLGEEFMRQAEAQSMRVQAALDPSFDASQIPEIDMLDAISRKAQERLVIAHVTQEIQANLNQVEEILDRFFRDASERADLPRVPALMKQILGALMVLEQDRAVALVEEAMRRIGDLAASDGTIAPADLNWVAEALSLLGLFVENLRYGKADTSAIVRILDPNAVAAPVREATIEHQVREEASKLQEAVVDWAQQGGDESGRQTLKTEIGQLARDAELIGDTQLRQQADAALQALETETPVESIQAVVEDIAPTAIASPAPSAEAVRLAQSSDEAIEREMLDTFIEEAQEVLGSIAVQLARLNVVPMDSAAMATIRRGFHTLKGSGRMVGLTDLGEIAWEVEQTLNQWLRDERAPTPVLTDFMEKAADAFQDWVDHLAAQGQAQINGQALTSAARALRGALEEAPPPKPEADGLAGSPAAVGASAPDAVSVDSFIEVAGHSINAELFRIFIAEAAGRLDDLNQALTQLGEGTQPGAWERFIRSAHTLAGISRTTGFTSLSDAAHAVEIWGNRWEDKTAPLSASILAPLAHIHGLLSQAVSQIGERLLPTGLEPIEAHLATLVTPSAALDVPEAELAPEPELEPEPEAELEPEPEPLHIADEDIALASLSASEFHPKQAPIHHAPRDELDAQLLPIFLEEAAELLPRVGAALRDWRAGNGSAPEVLKRALHTLKGSARMAGAMTLGERVHALETRVIDAASDGLSDAALLDELEADHDLIHDLVDHLKAGPEAVPVISHEAAPTSALDDLRAPLTIETPIFSPPGAAPMPTRQNMRLKSDILDTLLNEAGEVAIVRNRIGSALSGYKQTAQELAANVDRLRSQLRELEIQAETQMRSRMTQMEDSQFDPLEFDRFSRLQELTRLLAESVNDVSTAQDNMLLGLNEADTALTAQARMTRSMQQELMHIRMVPLDTLAERLHRVVRQSAKETGRRAQLEINGGQTELDRSILDKIAAPLEHLVRNAVAHGIETPGARLAAGKGEYGEITLAAVQEGNEIIITLGDDGAGIDFAAVRRRGEEHGWLTPEQEVTRAELEAFLFRSGFSTAEEVTELAGRGIGLDVVKNDIAGIGGRVLLDSEAGQGTRFTIRLPLTLALTQVVLARAGGQTWALPASLITLVREVRTAQVPALHEAGVMELGGEAYPLRTLAELVGLAPQHSEGRYRTFLLLRAGERKLAIRVDQLEGNFEAVVKNIGPQLARIAGVSGATVLGDGRVALIIDPFRLAERTPRSDTPVKEQESEQAALIMVVDDSLTVRKITGRFLEREGFRVVTARDGVEALERLEDEVPVAMLLDIEMPRMDGFEVAHHVRSNSRTHHLPIIMITSRTAEKHRNHAAELGVNAYLGKPYNEEELLAEIVRLSTGELPVAA